MSQKHFNKVVCRIPQFSLNRLNVSENLDHVESYIKQFFQDEQFLEALYISSPDFYDQVSKYMLGEEFSEKRLSKFIHTALKYISRICSRSTPFGTFAGCGVIPIDQSTNIHPNSSHPFSIVIRLDMGLLLSFTEHLMTINAIKKHIQFYPNNTIYNINESKRYVEYVVNGNGERFYNLAKFEDNETINDILVFIKNGKTYAEIIQALIDDETSEEDVSAFLDELIQAKIMISEFEPMMTGITYHEQVLKILHKVSPIVNNDSIEEIEIKQIIETFFNIDLLCESINNGQKRGQRVLEELTNLCKKLPVLYPVKDFYQVDSKINFESTTSIQSKMIDKIHEGIKIFSKLTPIQGSSKLNNFKKKFSEKYNDAIVPLTEVLDPDLGLGYSDVSNDILDIAPFVDDIPSVITQNDNLSSFQWRKDLHRMLLHKGIEAMKSNEIFIELSSQELEPIPEKTHLFPPTYNAFVSIYGNQPDNCSIFYHNIGTASANAMFGRFGFLDDKFNDLIHDIADFEAESSENIIIAEINHLSETRVGNVMLRPKLRPYEIVYFTGSNKQDDLQIPLSDLLLWMNNGKLILWSQKHNKQVIPRLSNAHNYNKDTLPVYRFLCDMQEQNKQTDYYIHPFADIGAIPQLLNFVPRIQHKQFIFYPAMWFLEKLDFQHIYELPDADRVDGMKKVLIKRNIPQHFILRRGDNELIVDRENQFSMEMFMSEIHSYPNITLVESLHSLNTSIVHHQNQSYSHELLIPFKNEKHSENLIRPFNTDILKQYELAKNKQRIFFPGNEWVFFKMYGGVNSIDLLLKNKIPIIVEELYKQGFIKNWFFIRYTDPDFHLRIRFQITHAEAFSKITSIIYQYLSEEIQHQSIKKIVLDVYERELERYHPQLIEQAEKIFGIDSTLCINLLADERFSVFEKDRWIIAIAVIHAWMDVFELDEETKKSFIKERRDAFANEFRANKVQRRHLHTKFKASKSVIDLFLDQHMFKNESVSWVYEYIHQFKKALIPIMSESYLHLSLPDKRYYLSSFIHMFLVRFVRSKNRVHEYAIFSFIESLFKSQEVFSKSVVNE